MFVDFAVWQKTQTLIARKHFLQLLYPIYWLPKSRTLITGETFWFAKTQTFIAVNISWSTVAIIVKNTKVKIDKIIHNFLWKWSLLRKNVQIRSTAFNSFIVIFLACRGKKSWDAFFCFSSDLIPAHLYTFGTDIILCFSKPEKSDFTESKQQSTEKNSSWNLQVQYLQCSKITFKYYGLCISMLFFALSWEYIQKWNLLAGFCQAIFSSNNIFHRIQLMHFLIIFALFHSKSGGGDAQNRLCQFWTLF